MAVAVLDGYIYALGGYDGDGRPVHNSAERYLPRTNVWEFIAPMRHQRSDASAAALEGT